ncbi:hypothetical protein F2P79_011955 [Pimephales promelas]|nr:hypothetical protein F2P79_011955 [Pimephales promelas]
MFLCPGGRNHLGLHSLKQQHGPWITQWKTRDRTRAASPPLPVFEISTRNRFSTLREPECDDAVIIGTSMVRHCRATSDKGKVRTHCFPGARVLDVAAQVPEILNGDERVGAVVLHAGTNDIRLRQTEVLKKDYRSLIETVRSTAPKAAIIVSGPLPTYRQGQERDPGCTMQMDSIPAESERLCCRTTSPRHYAPDDYSGWSFADKRCQREASNTPHRHKEVSTHSIPRIKGIPVGVPWISAVNGRRQTRCIVTGNIDRD